MTWVVGKNIYIDTFPKDFFKDKASIGINHAAIAYKTAMAFSGYPRVIKEFLMAGYTLKEIIGVKPSVKLLEQHDKDDWPSLFPGILNDPIYYNNHLRIDLKYVAAEMHLLMTGKDATHAYHNNGTSLQLLLYWCVLHDRTPIRVCGCNQTFDCSMEGCPKDTCNACDLYHRKPEMLEAWEQSKAYTAEIIRCMNLYGDNVRFYKDYDDCITQENHYASLRKD